jgi:hypothetical protein
MSNFHDLDEIISALRGPATVAELSGEADTIALMAPAHNTGGRTPMHFTSRRARVATLIAAGIIGFGGVAAAGAVDQAIDMDEFSAAIGEPDGGTSGEESIEETAEDATTEEAIEAAEEDVIEEDGIEEDVIEEDVLDEEVIEEEVIEEEAPTPEEIVVNEAGCVTDDDGNELNHGKTVSAVARGLIPDAGWASVSAAAQSDCGKKHTHEDGTPVEEDPAPAPAEDETVDEGDEAEPAEGAADPAPENSDADASATLTTGDSGQGKGAGNGKANGNNGRGNGK